MGIQQIPAAASGSLTPAGSSIITSTNASWPIPNGAKLLKIFVKGGDGVVNGGAGGSSTVTAGATTYTARGGQGVSVISTNWPGQYASGPTSGEIIQIYVSPTGLSTLNIVIGGGVNGFVNITHYV